ncbi:MAG TPA: FUSC family protein [Gammaproteobacteria bacterium]|nr:FUSC family protein [Gammaproteobacteria bacterium]
MMKNPLSNISAFWRNFDFTSPRAINSLKTAIACVIGYLLVIWTPLPQPQWIVITILVVMSAQTSLGSLTIKSYMRFWGTVAGAGISAIIYLCIGTDPVGMTIALFIVVLAFAYVASSPGDASYAGTLGAVTVAIILLNPVVNLQIISARFIEIIVGIIISLLVSKLIFPIHSQHLLLHNLANNLLNLQRNFDRSLKMEPQHLEAEVDGLDAKIASSFATQRKLIREVGFELKYRQQKPLFQEILQTQIKIYRANNLMFLSAHVSEQSVQVISELTGLEKFKLEANQSFMRLAEAIRSEKKHKIEWVVAELIDVMEGEFKKIINQKQYEHIAYVNAFLFGARMFMVELIELGKLIEAIQRE